MRILAKNLKKGFVKLKIENLDDLWYLSQIIDSNDVLKGKTTRKIKLGESSERNAKVFKKSVFIAISVEKLEFHKYSNVLRVSGKVTACPDDVARGSYHSFNIEPGTMIGLSKQMFLKYQIDKLEEAAQPSKTKILICIFDRDEAFFAISKKYGYELLTSISGEVAKKDEKVAITKSFYKEIIKELDQYNQRLCPTNIVVASPSFWKDEFMKEELNKDLKQKIVLATCSSVKEDAIAEVLKRQEIQNILKQDRIAKEINAVAELLTEISKEGKAVYGLRETKKLVEAGAVDRLLITDKFIQKKRLEESFQPVEYLMKLVEQMQGEIMIISSDHDGGKQLDGLGGIAGLLRYKVNY